MTKIDEVRAAMMEALKKGDKPRKAALSLLLSALKKAAIDKRADLTEEEENAIVYKEIREAKETLETTPPGRNDVIEECNMWIAVWSEFAPERMNEAEIRQFVYEVLTELGLESPTLKDKGRIMKTLMDKLRGKAEGRLVNKVVNEIIG